MNTVTELDVLYRTDGSKTIWISSLKVRLENVMSAREKGKVFKRVNSETGFSQTMLLKRTVRHPSEIK